ncbi:WG repeat-containing protein [Suttonella sp. R2A3]|uniref:WG repeat-containing protein n=1 Tax=Suttonella sp. R2A3 TaxID=2908648 RepID=UPI001F39A8F7|nr:WG repeat-containing protein [Suttonella sp. R2A3]UJF24160.1 WG repeat-containing protein [Suttonella sp. R2A3]
MIARVAALALTSSVLLAQAASDDLWTAFDGFDENGEILIGFKDADGEVVLEPQFSGITHAKRLEHLMGYLQYDENTVSSGVLLKTGERLDYRPYAPDAISDCESEGTLRAYNADWDMGLLDHKGQWIIPAEYNHLSRVQNGMSVVLSGARRSSDDEHWSWLGGSRSLVDRDGTVIVADFVGDVDAIDWFSFAIGDSDDPLRDVWQGVDGKRYNAVNTQREFNAFVEGGLVNALAAERYDGLLFEEIVLYYQDKTLTREQAVNDPAMVSFLRAFKQALASGVEYKPYRRDKEFGIFSLNLPRSWLDYVNHCDDFYESCYPVYQISWGAPDDTRTVWFLRSEDGYQILAVEFNLRAQPIINP